MVIIYIVEPKSLDMKLITKSFMAGFDKNMTQLTSIFLSVWFRLELNFMNTYKNVVLF